MAKHRQNPCPHGTCILVGKWGETPDIIYKGNVIDAMEKNKVVRRDGNGVPFEIKGSEKAQ